VSQTWKELETECHENRMQYLHLVSDVSASIQKLGLNLYAPDPAQLGRYIQQSNEQHEKELHRLEEKLAKIEAVVKSSPKSPLAESILEIL
jgi:hypothetical protein